MNKRLLNPILLFAFLLLSGTAYSQAVSMTAATGGLATAAQVSGTNDIAILGVQLTKAAGGGNTLTSLTVTMTPTPVGKFTTARLFKSTNNTFDGVGSETEIATGTISATDITFTGAPLTNFDGATALADDEYLFVVVNVDPTATTGSTTTPSLINTGVVVSTGTTSGSTINGAAYTLTAPQITIANVTNSLAGTPLIAGATTQPVLGFSLTSTGNQNVSAITVDVTSTAVGKWSSYTLWQSDDNDFLTAGNNTNAGGSFNASSGTTIVITGLNQNITTTTKYYFLTVNVDNGVNGGTATIRPSLANTALTSTPATGTVTGTATGPAAAYAFAPRLTIANLLTGLAADPLIAGTTGQAVFGFSLTSSSSQTVTTLNVQLTNTPTPANKWTNYKIYRSTDADYSTPGDNTEITTAVITPSSNQIQIGSLTEAITTGTNYFLVVDINPAVTGATTTIEPSLAPANVTITTGGGIATGTATGTNYSFSGATATFASVTGGVSPSPLLAGTNHAVLGFSASSNATQNFSALNVQVSSNPSGKWGSYSLVRSVDADFATGGDNTTIGSLTITGAPTQITITGLNETLNGTAKNYFLVVTVDPSVTSSTGAILPSFTQTNVTVAGNIVPVTITGTNYSFNTSQSSDIILNGSTTASIAYQDFQDNPISGFPNGSTNLGDYIIRDGGGSADGDNKATTVTAISLEITHAENLRQIVLYDDSDDTEILGTQQAVTGTGTVTIVFTPDSPIIVPDGGTFEFKVRASFEELVTDKHAIQVSIVSVTAPTTGSGFSPIGTWASTQTASNTNVIAVVATKYIVTCSPTSQAIASPITVTVQAVDDIFENRDLDFTGTITLQRSPSGGTFTAAQAFTQALVTGQFIWTNVQFSASNTYTITANDNPHGNPLENGQRSIVITASSSTVTQATDPVLCYGGTTSAELLSPIVITETDAAGFSGSNGSYTFSLALPSGFVFDQSVTSGLTLGGGSDLSAPSAYTYPSANIVQFSFTLNGSANTNTITIAGLRVRHPHPGIETPAPTGVLNITRSGGTANIAGVGAGAILGTISASQNNPSVDFTVSATVGNIDESTTSFNVSSPPVNLLGTGTPAGVFSGSGVTPGPYRFNPNTLSQGEYDITYLQTSANGCQSVAIKTFTVFDSGIGGLNASYCANDDPSNTFTVSQTFIDNIFGTGWTLDHYTYYDPFLYVFQLPLPSNATAGATFINNGQTFTVVKTISAATVLLCSGTGNPAGSGTLSRSSGSGDLLINYSYFYNGDFRQITSPVNNQFDPELPIYQPIYNYFGGQIPIGFAVCNGGSVPCNGNSNYGTFSTYQWVTVRTAPTASFTLPSDVYTFCNDNGAVTLIGSPPNGTNPVTDNFSTQDANGLTAISSALVSGERVWSFLPAAVNGVDATTPQTINIKYEYTDPATNCSNSSTRPVTVYFRPSAVPVAGIEKIPAAGLPTNDKTIIQLCQNTTIPFSFSVSDAVTYNYRWYEGTVSPGNLKGTSTTFAPPVNTATPGNYPYVITRERNGCESITSNLSLQVRVIALPAAPAPNFSDALRQYCVDTDANSVNPDHLNVPGTNLTWYNSTGSVITPIADPNLPTPAELSITTNTAQEYNFSVSQTETVNFCEGPRTPLKVSIKALPVVAVTAAPGQDPAKICTTGGTIRFIGRDLSDPGSPAQNGTWTVSSSAGVKNDFPSLGEVDLNPLTGTPGTYTLQYTYENSGLCENTGSIDLTILPKLTPLITIAQACLGAPSVFTIDPSTPASAVYSVSWDFGDGQQLPRDTVSESIDPAVHDGKTTGQYGSPNHIYPSIGNFTAKGVFTTEEGCNYELTSTAARIYPMPKASFTSQGVCVGAGTIFKATTDIPVVNYRWKFATGGNLGNASTFVDTPLPDITHTYNTTGTDLARLIVTTNEGCKDSLEKKVYVVPNLATISPTSTYTENFTSSKGGWIEGGRNLSWQWGTPASAPTSTNGSGWHTTMDKNNESSWILSGCFSFDSDKPVLSLDVWSDGSIGVDGAVIQYNTNGNIEDDILGETDTDGEWERLGVVNSGINWYDAQGISNNPGNQTTVSAGWTGKYPEWRTAIYKLDDLIGRNNVVFRIAFATNAPKLDANGDPYTGFAFDNIFIGERNRIVLQENFTNSSGIPNSSGQPSTHNIANYENFPTAGGTSEVVRVQYHTGFPGPDPINALNTQMNNSRAAFYGITLAPNMRMDGDFGIGSIASWLTDSYDDRVLTPAELKLNVTAVKEDGVVKINTSVENTTSQTVPAVAERLHIFTVIVDELVNDPDLLGNSGKTQFINVAREMLPSAAGVPITADIQPGPTNAYVAEEIIWNKPNGTKVVVFVQKINDERKEVYQAAIVTPVGGTPDVVTGTEDPEYAKRISLFPNPANNEVNIHLPVAVNKPTPVMMVDAFGRIVYQSVFQAGERTKTVSTSTFADGIYMLQLAAPQGSKVVKKVMVKHQ